MKKEIVKKMLRPHIIKHRGSPAIKIPNTRLDFKETFMFKGVTKSGNVKLGEIYSENPKGIKTINRMAKISGTTKNPIIKLGHGSDSYRLHLKKKSVLA